MRRVPLSLFLLFLGIAVTAPAQPLDSMVVITDYFTQAEAKKRLFTYGDKRDSTVVPSFWQPRKVFMAHPKKLLGCTIGYTYRINAEVDVPRSRYNRERIAWEKRFYQPYLYRRYHKNGQLLCEGLRWGDAFIDTLQSWDSLGRLVQHTVHKFNFTGNYRANSGIEIIERGSSFFQYFQEDGSLRETQLFDYVHGIRTVTNYRKGNIMKKVTEKL